MALTITTIAGTDGIKQSRPIINSNFDAIKSYINDLEGKINPSANTLTIKTATVGSGGLTVNSSDTTNAIIVNAGVTNSFLVTNNGSVQTKAFIQGFGKWSNSTPTLYNQIKGVLRIGDPTDSFLSSTSSGFLVDCLYPSANKSLAVISATLLIGLDPFKDTSAGGVLSQVMRINNTQITRRLLLTNNGGQTGGNAFATFTPASVNVSAINASVNPSALSPENYGHVCYVKLQTAGDCFYVDTTGLENGEYFWIVASPDTPSGYLINGKTSPSTIPTFCDADNTRPTGAGLFWETVSGAIKKHVFSKTTRLLCVNTKDPLSSTADRLQIWSFTD